MNKTIRTLATSLTALALTGGALLASSTGAQAASFTPWNNPYLGSASVRGVAYAVKFIGSGPHVYKSVSLDGCNQKLAKQYTVSIYKEGNPSAILYRKAIDGAHMAFASEPFDSGSVKFKSATALVKSVKSKAEASAKVAAWAIGGKVLAGYRAFALADDFNNAVPDQLTAYAREQAKKIVASMPVDPEVGAPAYVDYMDGISLDGYDVAAHMKSTKALYGSGCGTFHAQFERKVSVSGTYGEREILETNVTDNVTIGWERATHRYFRLVGAKRTYFSTALKAADAQR